MKRLFSRALIRFNESAAIAAFGVSFLEKVKIFFSLLLRNNQVAFPLTFRFSHNTIPFTLTFLSHADLMLFHEIFSGHPYKLHTKVTPEYVIDLGANIGISTLYLHTRYPKAKIVAVEANPALLPRLKETLKGIPAITTITCAVSGEDGTVSFYIDEEQPLGSSLVVREGKAKEVRVEAHTLESIQKAVNFPVIDFIKFDIEGAEYEVFASYSKRTEIRAMVGEVHEDLMGVAVKEFEKLWGGMRLRLVPTKKQHRFNIYGMR